MADEKYDNDINFSKVLFLHINRILMSTDDQLSYILKIEALEDALYPYWDEEYEEDLKKKQKAFSFYGKLDPLMGDRDSLQARKRIELARQKFRALQSLADRHNLLLEREGEGIDPGDTSEGYDAPDKH